MSNRVDFLFFFFIEILTQKASIGVLECEFWSWELFGINHKILQRVIF